MRWNVNWSGTEMVPDNEGDERLLLELVNSFSKDDKNKPEMVQVFTDIHREKYYTALRFSYVAELT